MYRWMQIGDSGDDTYDTRTTWPLTPVFDVAYDVSVGRGKFYRKITAFENLHPLW